MRRKKALAAAFVVTSSSIACGSQEPSGIATSGGPGLPGTTTSSETDASEATGTGATAAATGTENDVATDTATVEPDGSADAAQLPTEGQLNPRTADGRAIHLAWQGDGCFFYKDFPPLKPGEMRPPGSAPPSQTIACPPVMTHPVFKECRGGVVSRSGDDCECFVSGNPPRVEPVVCP